ncbi:MBL fold metallo-hydrolase [Frankia sp. CNm7]|uniref:MBL fold metallo-hydrolase n=1 Tax=Frankia nepalensis TaxID=1836974 RepID=A0A937RIY0_9ACTN|nr:MBL fold metallo-hydrolase [Frankia nepalensis]MBL7495653.1 MBL fold metallo-hydrolase [Frankia nepalensis]MBL7510281.1 MBL fold metallo-hydrolase [Frankia nepalensis]MBL7520463.1 MBL fold metallo-hydrolase [Frankia nepalensis]MBL7631190.1 MBL fold metallo-hydrolase [Frankia nepalensis]
MTSLMQPPSVDLPPVERLRPGLWSIPVPLPSAGLRHVFVYLFETDAGGYIVDAGWDTAEAYDALAAGLAIAGYRVSDVRGVLATHMHHDHYGLAERIRAESGAWVALHPADAEMIKFFSREPADLRDGMNKLLIRAGMPAAEIEAMNRALPPMGPIQAPSLPDVLLEDGERPDVPGWDLRAIWTPGHSPGHLCFWEPTNQLLLAGDHVLPRITPNIPFSPAEGADPLGDFLASLDKVEAYPADEVLPAHEFRIPDLSRRLAELRAHHDQRFAEVIGAIRDGATTAWDICQRMTWSRPWHEVEGFMKRAALAEGMAHLRALARRGVLREVAGDPPTWELLVD